MPPHYHWRQKLNFPGVYSQKCCQTVPILWMTPGNRLDSSTRQSLRMSPSADWWMASQKWHMHTVVQCVVSSQQTEGKKGRIGYSNASTLMTKHTLLTIIITTVRGEYKVWTTEHTAFDLLYNLAAGFRSSHMCEFPSMFENIAQCYTHRLLKGMMLHVYLVAHLPLLYDQENFCLLLRPAKRLSFSLSQVSFILEGEKKNNHILARSTQLLSTWDSARQHACAIFTDNDEPALSSIASKNGPCQLRKVWPAVELKCVTEEVYSTASGIQSNGRPYSQMCGRPVHMQSCWSCQPDDATGIRGVCSVVCISLYPPVPP